jgi:acyl-CoA thioester hydrolase
MGVVYYAHYFVWFEVARAEVMRGLGSTYRALEDEGVRLPVIDAECHYRRPARYDDEIQIRAAGRLVSPVRVVFDYEVFVKGEDEPVAVGQTVHAAIGRDGRPRRLPARVQEAFS